MTVVLLKEKPLEDYPNNIQRKMTVEEFQKAVLLYGQVQEYLAKTDFYKMSLPELEDKLTRNIMFDDAYCDTNKILDVTYGYCNEKEYGVSIRVTISDKYSSCYPKDNPRINSLSRYIDIYVHGLDYAYEGIDILGEEVVVK